MPTDNPYESGSAATGDPNPTRPDPISSERAAYNVVSDTIAGVNVRKSDNRFQAVFIFVSVIIAASIGAALAAFSGDGEMPWYGGAMIGGFAGLVLGFFASGIFLMIYRAVRHIQGRHE